MKINGFTLIEILVVLGITVILATGGFLSLSGLRRHQSLRLSAEGMVAFLQDAQQRSVSQEGGLGWGVHFENSATDRGYYLRFSGSDYSVSADKVDRVALPSGIEFADPIDGSAKDVSFAKISGLPDAAVEVKINLSNDSASFRTITINVQGAIEQK
ncbi:MAG: prepilin-type N-terminal cleavage/methylation domain-containing protein [bacterium]|nr:prepilin-type N-terminal cleavage/methylation domain-containing protein [bacterium]